VWIVNVAGTRTSVSAPVGLVRVAVPVDAECGRRVGAGGGRVEVDGTVALDVAAWIVLDVSVTLDRGAALDVRVVLDVGAELDVGVVLELAVEPPQATSSTTVGNRASTVSRRLMRPG
jgi:hypothetical protein